MSKNINTDEWDEYEDKLAELNEGLLEAYAAGFAKALETFEVDPEFSTDVEDLKRNQGVTEGHYYYWDGKSKPLKLWLKDQYDLEMGDDE